MKYLIIILSIISYSIDYKNTETTITLLSDKSDYVLSDTLINNMKTFVSDQKWINSHSINNGQIFDNLTPGKKYFLYNKKELIFEQEVFTLESEPKTNHVQITGLKADPGKIKVQVNPLEDVNTLILASLDEKFQDPNDGRKYSENSDVHIVFDGKASNSISSNILKYGKYKIRAYTYLGEGRSINYNISEAINNPRYFYPQLFPPLAKSVIGLEENVYQIEWEQVDGALYYELQVSDNKDFKVIYEEYQNADVGNGNKFDIYIEDISNDVYWRIRAVGKGGKSDFSNIMTISEKK